MNYFSEAIQWISGEKDFYKIGTDDDFKIILSNGNISLRPDQESECLDLEIAESYAGDAECKNSSQVFAIIDKIKEIRKAEQS